MKNSVFNQLLVYKKWILIVLSFCAIEGFAQRSKVYLANNLMYSNSHSFTTEKSEIIRNLEYNEFSAGLIHQKYLFEISLYHIGNQKYYKEIFTHVELTDKLFSVYDFGLTLGYGNKLLEVQNFQFGMFALLKTKYQPKMTILEQKQVNNGQLLYLGIHERPNSITVNGGVRFSLDYKLYKKLSIGAFVELMYQYQNFYGNYSLIVKTETTKVTDVYHINRSVWRMQNAGYSLYLAYRLK
jgi:hypothetical protein